MPLSARDRDDLVALSRWAGASVLRVQGGGGNASVKAADGTMGIKASGFRMADVTVDRGWVAVDWRRLAADVRDPDLATWPARAAHEEAVRRARQGAALRPSLEAGFHAVLGRVVLHTHSVAVNRFACAVGGRELLEAALGGPVAWVPYAAPGYALSRAVDATGAARAMVLENHGLIVSGDTADEVLALAERFERLGDVPEPMECDPSAALIAVAERLQGAAPAVRPWRFGDAGASRGILVPDDVVYGIGEIGDDAPPSPRPARWFVRVAGAGYVVAGPTPAALRAMEENLLANVLLHERGADRHLPADAVAYLRAMEAEAYRQAVAAGSAGFAGVPPSGGLRGE